MNSVYVLHMSMALLLSRQNSHIKIEITQNSSQHLSTMWLTTQSLQKAQAARSICSKQCITLNSANSGAEAGENSQFSACKINVNLFHICCIYTFFNQILV